MARLAFEYAKSELQPDLNQIQWLQMRLRCISHAISEKADPYNTGLPPHVSCSPLYILCSVSPVFLPQSPLHFHCLSLVSPPVFI